MADRAKTARLIAAEDHPMVKQFWARQRAAQAAANSADEYGVAPMVQIAPDAEEAVAVAEWRAATVEDYVIANTVR